MNGTKLPDATSIAKMIRAKQISPSEVIEDTIRRAQAAQQTLNFLVSDMFDQARDRAKKQEITGAFAGVPYMIKDMFDVAGTVTRFGTRATQSAAPATNNAPMISAYEQLGLNLIGRSALGEFGFLPTTEPVAFGPTLNPWDLSASPGGSSGGAGAAVAAGVLPMADAADGGGSIRIPASCCGLFGFKPSRHRLIGNHPGTPGVELTVQHCISRSVRDSANLFFLTQRTGPDAVLEPVSAVNGPGPDKLKIAWVRNGYSGLRPDRQVEAGLNATIQLLEHLGHIVEESTWPFDGGQFSTAFSNIWSQSALGVCRLIEALSGVRPDASVLENFTLRGAERAASLPESAVPEALQVFEEVGRAYDAWFNEFDIVLSPVLLTPPVATGEITGETPIETLIDRIRHYCDYTALHNAIGAPAMSVPLHWTEKGLPVGMQFAARVGDERRLFELAFELEEARPWAHRRPPVFFD